MPRTEAFADPLDRLDDPLAAQAAFGTLGNAGPCALLDASSRAHTTPGAAAHGLTRYVGCASGWAAGISVRGLAETFRLRVLGDLRCGVTAG